MSAPFIVKSVSKSIRQDRDDTTPRGRGVLQARRGERARARLLGSIYVSEDHIGSRDPDTPGRRVDADHLEVDGEKVREDVRVHGLRGQIIPASPTTRQGVDPRERGNRIAPSTRCTRRLHRLQAITSPLGTGTRWRGGGRRASRSSTPTPPGGSGPPPNPRRAHRRAGLVREPNPSLGKEGRPAILAFVVLGVEVAEQAARSDRQAEHPRQSLDHADDAGQRLRPSTC